MSDQDQTDPAAPADFRALVHGDDGGEDTEGHTQAFVGEPDAGPQNAQDGAEGFAPLRAKDEEDDTEGHLRLL